MQCRRRSAEHVGTDCGGMGFRHFDPASTQADNGGGTYAGNHRPGQQGSTAQADDWGACAPGHGARDADWIIWKPIQQWMRSMLVSKEFRVMAKLHWLRWRSTSVSRWFLWVFRERWSNAAAAQLRRGRREPYGRRILLDGGELHKIRRVRGKFRSKNPSDIPVDSNELIALCAPRLTFISYGIPEKGDAKWLDHQGSFMATVAASPCIYATGRERTRRRGDTTPQKCRQ